MIFIYTCRLHIRLGVGSWHENKFIHHGCDLEENELIAIMNCVKTHHVDRNPKDRPFYQRGAHVFGHLGEYVALRFNAVNYADEFKSILNNLKETYGEYLNKKNISLTGIEKTIEKYRRISSSFNNHLNSIDRTQYKNFVLLIRYSTL